MYKKLEVVIDEALSGKKTEYVLKKCFGLSGGLITSIKKSKSLWVNGEWARMNHVVSTCDKVEVIIEDNPSEAVRGENIPLRILYEDEDVILVDKPYNMLSHPSKKHPSGTLANALCGYFGNEFTFRCITRLDRDTSGVVLVAKNSLSAHILNRHMKDGKIKKEYAAITLGVPNPREGEINAPIMSGEGSKHFVSPLGKEAVTKYKVEKVWGNLAFVRLIPLTGRTHQLRVHMSYIKTPIYSDFLYGKAVAGERTRLHCSKLEFAHPVTKKQISVTAPLPCDMTEEIVEKDLLL